MWYEALKISENKISRGCIIQIIITSKLQMQCKKGVYFSFDFGFPSILILSVKNGGGGERRGEGGCLTDKIQNLLSMAKFIC